jgi:hypothetical protein
LIVGFATVLEIVVWRNASPDLIKCHGIPMSLQETLDPGHKVMEYPDRYVIEVISLVEVVGFDMQKIPKDTQDRPCTD